ncbi:MAG: hypothetical protein JWM02_687 [Frankiales bacterium]|nr:hypothetical protein [Frankiales bacterium]
MRTYARSLAASGMATLVMGGVAMTWAPPASAHDQVSPSSAVAGSHTRVTVAAENEATQPTVGVEVRLPPGFTLGAPESLPGWTSSINRRADGTPTSVRWTAGAVAAGSVVELVLTGTVPRSAGSLVWVVSQLHAGGTWQAAPVDEAPRMTVRAVPLSGAGVVRPAAPAAAVRLASEPAATAVPLVDGVARSRAALALVLAVGAALGVLGLAVLLLGAPRLRARLRPADDAARDKAAVDRVLEAAVRQRKPRQVVRSGRR